MTQPQPTPISAPTAYPSPAPSAAAPQAYPHPQQGVHGMPQNPQPPARAPLQQPPMQPPHGQPLHPPQGHQMPLQQRPPMMQPQHGVPHPQMPPQNMQHAMPHSAPQAPYVEPERDGGEKAMPRIAIHAFCDRPQTAGAVQGMTGDWRMARTNLKVYMGGLTAAIEYYRNESTPGLVMFESGLRGEDLFAELEQLASVVDAGTKVVMLGATNDIRLYRELMDKGLSDYLVPPFQPIGLIRSLSELYSDPDQPFVGRVVAFFGAKGGVGSSTLAHNVAWGLASKLGQETALVDMDSSWGTTGLDFNYDSTQGLEEVLAETDRLDETLLDRIMVRHTDKLSILPAAASLGSPAPTSPESYEALVDGVRGLSPLTILDMPHIWSKWSSQILTSADDVVITATPDLANLRNTKNIVDFLKAARPNDAPPLLVLNKTGVPKTAEIPVKDFAAAVGLDPALVLAYEPVVYTEAANDGKMLSDLTAASAAFDGMMYLAQRIRTGHFVEPVQGKKARKRKKGKTPKAIGEEGEKKSSSLFAKFKKRK